MKRTRYEFHDGPPPRRGVYRVRSDGRNPNYGWRYWNGEAWGALASRRIFASAVWAKKPTHLRGRAVLWGSPVREPKAGAGHAAELERLRARVEELESIMRSPLPCWVEVEPATVVARGVTISTLIQCIKRREGKDLTP
jgi:hypothetical protein